MVFCLVYFLTLKIGGFLLRNVGLFSTEYPAVYRILTAVRTSNPTQLKGKAIRVTGREDP
jgi:hypothetical protein